MSTIQGVFTPIITPTTSDGHLFEEELRRYVRWLLAKGVHGLYPNGSSGEFMRFTLVERRRIVEITAEEAAGRIPIIAGAVESTIEETLESCRIYADLGCAVVSLIGLYYYPASQEAQLSYFRAVADKSALPVLLYNIPSFANPIALETIVNLCEHERVVGIKDSSRDLAAFMLMMREVRCRRPDFVCFIGTEELLAPAVLMGANGATVTSSGIMPEVLLALYAAAKAGDVAHARELQLSILPLLSRMFSIDFPYGFRNGVALRGFDMGPGPLPHSPLQQQRIATLREELAPMLKELVGE